MKLKSYLFVFLTAALWVSCSSETPKDSKSKGSLGAPKIIVEAYLASPTKAVHSSKVAGNLIPFEDVELKAETTGQLRGLYVKDGAFIKKGALIAKINDDDLQAQLKQAKAALELAKQKETRTKNLFEKDGVSQAELELALANTLAAEASYDLILAQIKKTEIRAPFSGSIGMLKVSAGEWMTAGTSVARLSNVQKLKVSFLLPQRYASHLEKDSKVTVTDSERGISAEATVMVLNPVLSATARSREFYAELINKDLKFLAGSFVEVDITFAQNQEQKVFNIPVEALTLDDKGPYVFLAKSGKAEIRYVKTGLRTPISVVVTEGLELGDTVIVSGMMSMRPGAQVQIKELRSPMNYEVIK
ncbi:MAG: efflux RND transporter periplasmic adaptor subunit [Fibrobacter sp.]|jgi:membrane fusion protein (multidrug efflux system)|nr:efflux RND transporter periplasmic adaptor subunit [Fibrobacter sp.]